MSGCRARFALLALTLVTAISGPAVAQERRPDLAGMWSDPPFTALDSFCYFFCTDAGLDYLEGLLDDPANDERPYPEISAEASKHQQNQYFRPRLTAAASATFPLDPADDPGFLYCEPWGFTRQIFAPHQLEIRQEVDRVEMRYGEWDARRTIYLDGRRPAADQPPTLLGHSVGRYEGDTLVIETSAVRAGITAWDAESSDQTRAVERYSRSADGERLLLSVTMEDPWSLAEPVVVKKVWSRAPDQQIFPYEDYERPTEFTRGTGQP